MSRILLADDSPHAQRMGERILREEGFEVVTVTDGETALIRLADVDPDVLMADVFLPHKSGYEICEFVKSDSRFRHTRVVLLAGLLEPVDQALVERVKADAVLKKPFEASAMIATLRPLVEAARLAREVLSEQSAPAAEQPQPALPPPPPSEAEPEVREAPPTPSEVEMDREQLRAAVTIALDPVRLDAVLSWACPMPDNSFDIASKIDLNEVSNAIQQTMKEVLTRYDLKTSGSRIELNQKDKKILLSSQDEFKLRAVTEILELRLVKRGVPLKGLSFGEVLPAAGSTVRQEVSIQQGIPIEKAREIVKKIKESKIKVQASIQGDLVRVSGKSRDLLQEVMQLLKQQDFGIDVQFTNYRTF
jgi:uncharacterized protein YajQ (UPF0234 family)/DNA-binding response OmpR family regulator